LVDDGAGSVVARLWSALGLGLGTGRDGTVLGLILRTLLWAIVAVVIGRTLFDRAIVAGTVSGVTVVGTVPVVVATVVIAIRTVIIGGVIAATSAVSGAVSAAVSTAVSGTIIRVRCARAEESRRDEEARGTDRGKEDGFHKCSSNRKSQKLNHGIASFAA